MSSTFRLSAFQGGVQIIDGETNAVTNTINATSIFTMYCGEPDNLGNYAIGFALAGTNISLPPYITVDSATDIDGNQYAPFANSDQYYNYLYNYVFVQALSGSGGGGPAYNVNIVGNATDYATQTAQNTLITGQNTLITGQSTLNTTIGETTDSAQTNPALAATLIAIEKGILSWVRQLGAGSDIIQTDWNTPTTLTAYTKGELFYLQQILNRFPLSLGPKTSAASFSVTLSTDGPFITTSGSPSDSAVSLPTAATSANLTQLIKSIYFLDAVLPAVVNNWLNGIGWLFLFPKMVNNWRIVCRGAEPLGGSITLEISDANGNIGSTNAQITVTTLTGNLDNKRLATISTAGPTYISGEYKETNTPCRALYIKNTSGFTITQATMYIY